MGQIASLLASPSLFPDSLISEKVRAALPEGFSLRPLQSTDFDNGHCDVLPFASVSKITKTQWLQRYEDMRLCEGTYYVVVIVDEKGKIQGTGTLFVERKFLFDLGIQGHIEDVSIAPEQQGKKFGQLLIQALTEIGEKVGCYKTILDCREAKEGFYLKCGYERRGLEMHHYHQAEAQKHSV